MESPRTKATGFPSWTGDLPGPGNDRESLEMKRWAVNWSEGMALTPQHMQAADHHLARRADEAADWFNPFSYGARKLELTVRSGEVILSECEVRFKDGTALTIPEDLESDELHVEFSSVLKTPGAVVTIYLAIPDSGPDRDFAEWRSCEDENGEALAAEVQFRRPKAVLLVGEEDAEPTGYRALPLAKISGTGIAPVILREYIPPLLVVDAWPTLTRDLSDLADRLQTHVKRLAGQLGGRPLAINPSVPNDATRVLKLLAFNGVDAHLRATCATPSLHPWWVFLELCRIAGQVATFRPERMLVNLPEYDHEDLGGCFAAAIREIDAGLLDEEPLPYDFFPFKRQAGKPDAPLEVGLRQAWLTEKRPIYLAVKCGLDSSECLKLLRAADLTIADGKQVERLHLGKRAGLDLRVIAGDAPGLQAQPNVHFFEFDDKDKVWNQAFAMGALAIKLNPKHFQPRGDEEVVVPGGDERFEFKFSLCVFHRSR